MPRWSESDENKHGRLLTKEIHKCQQITQDLEMQANKINVEIERAKSLGETVCPNSFLFACFLHQTMYMLTASTLTSSDLISILEQQLFKRGCPRMCDCLHMPLSYFCRLVSHQYVSIPSLLFPK
jgi:hypothetical protein